MVALMPFDSNQIIMNENPARMSGFLEKIFTLMMIDKSNK